MALTKPVEEALNISTLAANSTSAFGSCSQIDLSKASHFALTTNVDYHASAASGITVHLRSSPGSVTTSYDSVDVGAAEDGNFDVPSSFGAEHAGTTVQKTVPIEADFKYCKVIVDNNDGSYEVNNLTVDVAKQWVEPY